MKLIGIDSCMKDLSNSLDLFGKAKLSIVTENLKNNIVAATPIKTGAARANWVIQPATDGSKGLEIYNPLPYISRLNAGSSQQAPEYFIEQTVLNDPNVTPDGTIVIYTDA
jgi:hypothetical protein